MLRFQVGITWKQSILTNCNKPFSHKVITKDFRVIDYRKWSLNNYFLLIRRMTKPTTSNQLENDWQPLNIDKCQWNLQIKIGNTIFNNRTLATTVTQLKNYYFSVNTIICSYNIVRTNHQNCLKLIAC